MLLESFFLILIKVFFHRNTAKGNTSNKNTFTRITAYYIWIKMFSFFFYKNNIFFKTYMLILEIVKGVYVKNNYSSRKNTEDVKFTNMILFYPF